MLNVPDMDGTEARSGKLSTPSHVTYRRLGSSDAEAIRGHLIRLDTHARRMRFCGPATDQFIEKRVAGLDWASTVFIGAFIEGVLRGVGEIVRVSYVPESSAELALSVEPDFQNAGIGTELVRRLLTAARNRYIQKVYMLCLAENVKMQRIARKFEADLIRDAGEVEGRIRAPWPNYQSFMAEAWDDGMALLHAIFDPVMADEDAPQSDPAVDKPDRPGV